MERFAEGEGMPLGFGLALAQNVKAMERFAALSPQQKQQTIEHTKQISSKQDMKAYVQEFADKEFI